MTDVEILLALFAAIAAAILVFLIGRWRDGRNRIQSAEILLGEVYDRLSFEWKFLEEIVEEIFSSEDARLQKALRVVLEHEVDNYVTQRDAVDALLQVYVNSGVAQVEQIIYSKQTKEKMPTLSALLPLRRALECEVYLMCLEREGNHTSTQEGDVGEVLMRYKKLPGGNIRKENPPSESGVPSRGLALA